MENLIKRIMYSRETARLAREKASSDVDKEYYRGRMEAYDTILAISHESVRKNYSGINAKTLISSR